MAGGDIGRPRVDVFAVHLIGEEVQVVFLHQVAYLLHLAPRIEIARRVVRVADHDGACAVVDEFLEFLHLRQREALLNGGGYRADFRSSRDGEGHVVGVSRFGHDDFIARIEARQEGEEHRLGTARGDDDVIGRHVDVVLGIVPHQFLPVAEVALGGGVFENRPADLLQRVQSHLWCGQVGLSDVEVEDPRAPFLCCCGEWSEFPDGRLGHLQSADGYFWHDIS